MIACPVCTGRHHPQACPTARRYVDECMSGTPDDYREPPADGGTPIVVHLFDLEDYRRDREMIKKARWRARSAS